MNDNVIPIGAARDPSQMPEDAPKETTCIMTIFDERYEPIGHIMRDSSRRLYFKGDAAASARMFFENLSKLMTKWYAEQSSNYYWNHVCLTSMQQVTLLKGTTCPHCQEKDED